MRRVLHLALLALNLLVGITAVSGGFGLATGLLAPEPDLLADSILSSYLLPGLVLIFLVGGSAILAAFEIARQGMYRYEISVFAGATLVIFELVEWMLIGPYVLQAVFLGIGSITIALALILLLMAPVARAPQPGPGHPHTARQPHPLDHGGHRPA